MATIDARQADLEGGRMTLVEHLIELRTRVFRSLVAVVVGGVVCWVLYNRIFGWLIRPYCHSLPENTETELLTRDKCGLIAIDPLEGFGLRMTIAAYGGIALAIPVILWQVWRFVAPGLYKHERRYALPFVLIGVMLFCLGGGLAYWSLPKALNFLIKIGGPDLITVYSAKPYLSLVIKMIVAFGIGFEFPLVLAFLQMVGVIKPGTLARVRRHMAVGITAIVAVITPSGDPVTLIVLSVPMYLFYEIAIIYGRIWNRRRARQRATAGS
jgi:sec-independent protein translocase protein TatC